VEDRRMGNGIFALETEEAVRNRKIQYIINLLYKLYIVI